MTTTLAPLFLATLLLGLPTGLVGQEPADSTASDSLAAYRDSVARTEALRFYRAVQNLPEGAAISVEPDTLKVLNLQLLPGRVDLTVLRRFPAVEDLALPYHVAAAGPLADGSYTQLRYLDASNGNVDSALIQTWYLPNLVWLNVAESGVQSVACLEGFEQLETLLVARDQFTTSALATYQKTHPNVRILFRGNYRRLPRRFTQGELSTWIAEKLDDPRHGQRSTATGRVDIRFVIDTQGAVSKATVVAGLSPETDAAALRVVRGLRFEGGSQPATRTAYIYFRPR